jgi:methyl-accepting chemotaxis protein
MTDEELRTLVASLAISTANNAAEAQANTEAIKELRETLRDGAESQLRSIEMMRESISYNTETVASSLELAAEALKLSANTSRNLDRLENDIADLKQIVGIVIRDNQADRGRITRLEEQE